MVLTCPLSSHSRTMKIRERCDDDLDECVRILRKVHEHLGYPVNWPADPADWLSGGSTAAWVATIGGDPVGHVAAVANSGSALVERLFVDPEYSGAGIGRALLRHAASQARLMHSQVMLDVVAGRDAANGLYRAEGWTEVSRTSIAWAPGRSLIRFRAPTD
ncbi:GNAT family N-acetyltransferase [Nocardioidaceae bacterium SCSIO 66511]|nr:GNAT family N-acetyltransferase [Nocardioidaceae bacterium SCSIO 66511]